MIAEWRSRIKDWIPACARVTKIACRSFVRRARAGGHPGAEGSQQPVHALEICSRSLDKSRVVFFHERYKGERMTGTIKKIIKDKGFGFITPDEGNDEVFFHRSRLAPKVYFEDLREGDEVEFLVRPGEKGPQAFNLKLR
jgi:CspA family cold shock protein